jgi:ABC-type Zn uptake system ZnuABC Zn-binding protein ZnuA
VGVVATVPPLAFLAHELGGDRVRVATLVPGGASPHTFEPRPSDVISLEHARTLLRVGAGLDEWTNALLPAAPEGVAVWTATEVPGVLAPPHPGEPADPHVWLDPIRVRDRLAPALSGHLQALDPGQADGYRARLRDLTERLTRLHEEITSMLGHRRKLRYVALHPGWAYFADRYGLEEVGIVHGPALEEPTPRGLARLLDQARVARPDALLVEPQLDTRIGALLARELGTRALAVDPLGDERSTRRSSYEGLLRAAALAITERGTPTP